MTKKKPRPEKQAYWRALVDEVLLDLGRDVHHFRNLGVSIGSSEMGKEVDPDILFLIDGIYQKVFDNIIDDLANADDIHAEKIAISGLEKSMRVRRGFCKKSQVL